MIYISIPEEMTFTKITNDKETRDCLVNKEGNIIELQSLVKDALRTNTGRKNFIELNEITLYLRTPPNTDKEFLAYTPNRNGKYSTEIEPHLIKGNLAQKYDPKLHTRYGIFWHQETYLSREKQDAVDQHMLEQKENRRHYGDSPLAT